MRKTNWLHLWDVITVLTHKDIKLRYRGTVLGILWSLANPLAFTFVLYIAFKRVLQVEIENYSLFILSALFPWQWVSNSLNAASLLFISNAQLIKKLLFPRIALCLAVVLSEMIHFVITIPVYAVLSLLTTDYGFQMVWLVGIPMLLLIQAMLMTAAMIIISTLNAFLRDLEQLVRVFLLLLFYLTPILYPASMVSGNLQWLLVLNPFSPLIISWRALLFDNALSPFIGLAFGHALFAMIIAVPVYKKMSWRLAEVV